MSNDSGEHADPRANHRSPVIETSALGSSEHRSSGLNKADDAYDKRRRSGGFLLHSLPTLSPQSPRLRPTSDSGAAGRRMGRLGDNDLTVQKRRRTQKGYLSKLLPRSSPLATEVTNIANADEARYNGTAHDPDEISSIPSTASYESSRTVNGNLTMDRLHTQPEHEQLHQHTRIGHDTDPAQIVNLALSLSENRRRNVTPGSLPSLDPNRNMRHA